MSTTTRLPQILQRRRVVMRVGLVVIVLASATACIFDKSDYQGGGHIDKGGTAVTASQQPTVPPTDTTSTPVADAGDQILDTGTAD